MKTKTINLATYCSKELKLLAGRDKGIEMRKRIKLEEYESDKDISNINVEVPNYIKTMTSSYILGLVGVYIEKYGEDQFRSKYSFKCNEVTRNNIEIAIKYVTTNKEG